MNFRLYQQNPFKRLAVASSASAFQGTSQDFGEGLHYLPRRHIASILHLRYTELSYPHRSHTRKHHD